MEWLVIVGVIAGLGVTMIIFARKDATSGLERELQRRRADVLKALSLRKRAKNVAELLERARRRRGD
jgi:hypothetical protein